QALGEDGAKIMLTSRKAADLEESAATLQAAGIDARWIAADCGQEADIQRLAQETLQRMGDVDILVNNAGVERRADFWDVTEEDYDLVMDTNVKGLFFATQAFVRHVRAHGQGGNHTGEAKPSGEGAPPGRGVVVNISSVHEEIAFPHFASYCASKGALRML
ncbi:SDR family NAD(P)-dependent oxidoreductase, partial [Raoultella sp. 18093]|uniref:SDR family NAD(P)-dependent oxidoreductase n=1 Tax=Raoultella sp. 18093 TaxID=2681425 RepID=UPI0013586A9C